MQWNTANLLKEINNDVKEEPLLQEVTGEHIKAKAAKKEKDTRPHVAAREFWMQAQPAFLDIRVFSCLGAMSPECSFFYKHLAKPYVDVAFSATCVFEMIKLL